MDSVQYHDWLIRENKETPLQACTGDEFTNEILQDWLERTLQSIDWPFEKMGEKVLEVMAGYGRNYEVLAQKFEQVEMLDGSEELSKINRHPVVKHVQYIQKFVFPLHTYDCIVGVFCLCYLSEKEIEKLLPQMEESLTILGSIVLMEPVLKVTEDNNPRKLPEQRQHMAIRSAKYYTRLFRQLQLKVVSTRRDEKKGQLLEDVMTFVLRDGTTYFD